MSWGAETLPMRRTATNVLPEPSDNDPWFRHGGVRQASTDPAPPRGPAVEPIHACRLPWAPAEAVGQAMQVEA